MPPRRTRHDPGETTGQTGELERIGPDGRDAVILPVAVGGMDRLDADGRRLVYCLYRAAVAGEPIAWHQTHRNARLVRDFFETIHRNLHLVDARHRPGFDEYVKLLWIHHGPYHHHTHTKFLPHRFDEAALRGAADAVVRGGGEFPASCGNPATEIDQIAPFVFDPEYEPIQTNQSEGIDVVASSSVNYWDRGVTAAMIDALDDEFRHRINVRFALDGHHAVPQIYRRGGLYGDSLDVISHWLTLALPLCRGEEQRAALEALLGFYRSGDEHHFREHMRHWLACNNDVDFLNGFIEAYNDPRGVIGHFAGNVSIRTDDDIIRRISDNALYFEHRMPWPEKYRRTSLDPPVAHAVEAVVETGDSGPISPAAYNLPNYSDIRRNHGSKNVVLANIENTWSPSDQEAAVREFFLPEYQDIVRRHFRPLVRSLQVYLHEIVGHGSGLPDPALPADPRVTLGRLYSALEECRADLVALYHIGDRKLAEIGAYAIGDTDAVLRTSAISYLQGWFARFDTVDGLEVREAHNKGHHLILQYILGGGRNGTGFGARIVEASGNFFVRIDDFDRVHEGFGELLRRIQVIKSTGDARAAADLFDRFGTHLRGDWKANVTARRIRLKSARLKAFVFPRLEPVLRQGRFVDARIHHDETLAAQQYRFRRIENSIRFADDMREDKDEPA